MSGFWHRLRNELALRSAYRNVNNLTGDDLAKEQLLAPLRQFAAAPANPSAIPVGLLQEFNASQRRIKGHKKFRYGAGGLFAAIILFPGLAWAGVLPPSVARVVQQVFNVVSLPIHIPSAATDSAKPSGQTPNQAQLTSGGSSSTPVPDATPSEPSANQLSSTTTPAESTGATEPESNTHSTLTPTQTTTKSGVSTASQPSDDGELSTSTKSPEPMSENGGTAASSTESSTTSSEGVTGSEPTPTPTGTATTDPSPTPTPTDTAAIATSESE